MKYLLGVDFGGGASKATLISEKGQIIAENTVEYPTYHPSADACEQAPQDWLDALCTNTSAIIKKSGICATDISAVAIDSATHTSLVCDKDFVPLRNAIHWTDSRSRAEALTLDRLYGDEIMSKTYHRPSTIWTQAQLLWLKENEPEVFGKISYIFFEKDYIRFFLTGVFVTDYIEAEGSMLYNCNEQKWDESLCAMAGITTDMLPPLVKPTDIIGKITAEASEKTGLAEDTPVICGTTDTVLEVFASGAVNKGDVTVKLATAGRICVITDKPYPDRHLVNYSHVADGLWYPGTATKAAASSYRWYRDTFGEDYRELDSGAEQIPLGSDGMFFHPYINGELTPYGEPSLCGSFTGVRATHTKPHFTRAVLEGVGYSLLDSKRYLDSLGIDYNKTATVIGGGAKGKLWRQIVADMLGIELVVTTSSDSSLGSAMLAGVAIGVFKNPEDAVKKCVQIADKTVPIKENTEKYAELFKDYKRIADALLPIYRER
ncbi:MAG: xylulokinase [Ruminococcaceae bacterium]|nr:xylulokinase [Oscillospiraceae bacterium]